MPKWFSLTPKFLSFWHVNFWKITILHLHGQYAYQMKAKIILILYLSSKSTIGYENFMKEYQFQIFLLQFWKKKKNSNANFSKFLFQYPQNFILEWFLTPKKKFTWRIDNPCFIIDKIVSVRKCFGHFVPPLSLIRVKYHNYFKHFTALASCRIFQ